MRPTDAVSGGGGYGGVDLRSPRARSKETASLTPCYPSGQRGTIRGLGAALLDFTVGTSVWKTSPSSATSQKSPLHRDGDVTSKSPRITKLLVLVVGYTLLFSCVWCRQSTVGRFILPRVPNRDADALQNIKSVEMIFVIISIYEEVSHRQPHFSAHSYN
jgi:hypothetical protein